MTYAPADLARAAKQIALKRAIDVRRARTPFEWYEPSYPGLVRPDGKVCGKYAGQLRFHQSVHVFRCLVPGNGWGKTTAMGAEAHMWASHSHRWQKTPAWPVLMVWFVKLSEQFDLIRNQLRDEVFGSAAEWKDEHFTWADGSKLYIGKADQSGAYLKWEGVPVDLVFFDEMPPEDLYRAMAFRRRGRRKTRFVVGATAVDPDRQWAEDDLYKPWLQHHAAQGLTEEQALVTQSHPRIYLWTRGGVEDNPGTDDEDRKFYDEQAATLHPELARVRRQGGFGRWTDNPVFEAADIAALREAAAVADLRAERKSRVVSFTIGGV